MPAAPPVHRRQAPCEHQAGSAVPYPLPVPFPLSPTLWQRGEGAAGPAWPGAAPPGIGSNGVFIDDEKPKQKKNQPEQTQKHREKKKEKRNQCSWI